MFGKGDGANIDYCGVFLNFRTIRHRLMNLAMVVASDHQRLELLVEAPRVHTRSVGWYRSVQRVLRHVRGNFRSVYMCS